MPSAAEAASFGSPPRYGHDIIPINRLGLTGHLYLTAPSGGAVELTSGAAGTITSITVGGQEILGATITYASSLDNTARLAVKQINNYSANHDYWAEIVATAKIGIWPKNPWATTGAVTVTTTIATMTKTDTNMNSYQAFVAAARLASGGYGAANIAGTSLYAVGIDMSNMPTNTQTVMGTTAIGSHRAMKMNPQSIVGYQINMTADQNVQVYQGYEGADLIVADATFVRRTEIDIFQWREIPTFLKFAAASTMYFKLRGF